MLKVNMSAKQCQFTMSYILNIFLFIVAYCFFFFLFTSCVLKDQMNFSKYLFFRILSSSPEPIDQCQPNLALSAAPVGDGLPSFFNEGICYLKR